MGNLALEASGPERKDFLKRSMKNCRFLRGAQDAKSGHGGVKARNERFYKEKH